MTETERNLIVRTGAEHHRGRKGVRRRKVKVRRKPLREVCGERKERTERLL